MNICWFNHRCIRHPDSGGSEEHLHQIAKRLVKHGHSVSVFCESFSGHVGVELIDGVTYSRGGNKFTVHLRSLWVVLTQSFDLVIDDIAHAVPWGSPLLHKDVIAIVHHIHGDVLLTEAGPFLGRVLRFAESLIPRIYVNNKFITVSNSTRDSLEKNGICKENISIVHNGVTYTLSDFQRAVFPQLIYFGRYKKYKNLDQILELFQKLHSVRPDSSLVLAGKGTDDPKLTDLILSLGLQGFVHQYGEVPEQIKADLLSSSWVNLVASTVEGWSITTIEAALYGTPTIAFDVKGLHDSIIHDETGILVPNNDKDSYLEHLLSLIEDETRLSRMSDQARKHASLYSWDAAALQFNNLISLVS